MGLYAIVEVLLGMERSRVRGSNKLVVKNIWLLEIVKAKELGLFSV